MKFVSLWYKLQSNIIYTLFDLEFWWNFSLFCRELLIKINISVFVVYNMRDTSSLNNSLNNGSNEYNYKEKSLLQIFRLYIKLSFFISKYSMSFI